MNQNKKTEEKSSVSNTKENTISKKLEDLSSIDEEDEMNSNLTKNLSLTMNVSNEKKDNGNSNKEMLKKINEKTDNYNKERTIPKNKKFRKMKLSPNKSIVKEKLLKILMGIDPNIKQNNEEDESKKEEKNESKIDNKENNIKEINKKNEENNEKKKENNESLRESKKLKDKKRYKMRHIAIPDIISNNKIQSEKKNEERNQIFWTDSVKTGLNNKPEEKNTTIKEQKNTEEPKKKRKLKKKKKLNLIKRQKTNEHLNTKNLTLNIQETYRTDKTFNNLINDDIKKENSVEQGAKKIFEFLKNKNKKSENDNENNNNKQNETHKRNLTCEVYTFSMNSNNSLSQKIIKDNELKLNPENYNNNSKKNKNINDRRKKLEKDLADEISKDELSDDPYDEPDFQEQKNNKKQNDKSFPSGNDDSNFKNKNVPLHEYTSRNETISGILDFSGINTYYNLNNLNRNEGQKIRLNDKVGIYSKNSALLKKRNKETYKKTNTSYSFCNIPPSLKFNDTINKNKEISKEKNIYTKNGINQNIYKIKKSNFPKNKTDERRHKDTGRFTDVYRKNNKKISKILDNSNNTLGKKLILSKQNKNLNVYVNKSPQKYYISKKMANKYRLTEEEELYSNANTQTNEKMDGNYMNAFIYPYNETVNDNSLNRLFHSTFYNTNTNNENRKEFSPLKNTNKSWIQKVGIFNDIQDFNNTYYSQQKIEKSTSLIMNFEDLIFVENKIKHIINLLNKEQNIANECNDYINFCNNCLLFSIFYKIFQNSSVIILNINYTLMSLIICYYLSFETEKIKKLYLLLLLEMLEIIYRNLIWIYEYLIKRITDKSGNNNIWVLEILSRINKFKENEENNLTYNNCAELSIEEKIKFNTNCLKQKIHYVLNKYCKDKETKFLNEFFNTIDNFVYEDILEFFNSKILRYTMAEMISNSKFFENTISSTLNLKVPYLTKQNEKKFSLVLDLDETLVYLNRDNTDSENATLKLRPGIYSFLEKMKEYCEIILFSEAEQEYVDLIVDSIEAKNKYFDYKLYKQHTVFMKNKYLKDLSRIGRPLNKIIIVDNKQPCFQYQRENRIYIKPFWGEDINDNSLLELKEILIEIFEEEGDVDVRDEINKHKKEIITKVGLYED